MQGVHAPFVRRVAWWSGFSSLYIQTLWLRQAFSLFEGNELFTGLYLSLWMLLVAAGARIGPHRYRQGMLLVIPLLIGVLSPLASKLIPLLWKQFFLHGSIPALWQVTLFTLGWLGPVCFLSGWVFRNLIDREIPSKIYAYEAWGGLVGGGAALLIPLFQPAAGWDTWLPLALWCLIPFGLWQNKALRIISSSVWIVMIISFLFLVFPEKPSSFETPQGQLIEEIYQGDTLYRLEGHLLPSLAYRPEAAAPLHFALMQAPDSPEILLIGPLNLSLMQDALKYNPRRLTWLDTSPWITRHLLQRNPYIIPARIEVLPFSQQQLHRLTFQPDIILVMNPEPSTLAATRWLTTEFASQAKTLLKTGGILSLNLPGIANYYASQLLKVMASTQEAMKPHFPYTRLITHEGTQILASTAPIDFSIQHGLQKAATYSEYVNPWFFNANDIERRSSRLQQALPNGIPPSSYHRPILLSFYLNYWFDLNQSKPIFIVSVIAILLVLIFRKNGWRGLIMFTFSGVAASLQIMLIFIFQVYTGKMYWVVGVFFSLFMVGLALGSQVKTRFPEKIMHALFAMAVILAFSLLPIYLPTHIGIGEFYLGLWIALIIGTSAWLTGSVYRLCSNLNPSLADTFYAADLAGGAVGSVMVSLLGVPLAGTSVTMLILLIMLLIGLFFSSVWDRSPKANSLIL